MDSKLNLSDFIQGPADLDWLVAIRSLRTNSFGPQDGSYMGVANILVKHHRFVKVCGVWPNTTDLFPNIIKTYSLICDSRIRRDQ